MKKFNLLLVFLLVFSVQSIFSQESYTSTKKFGIEDLPIRETRRMGFSGNIGWNGLTGVGLTLNSFITANIEVDAGLGISSTGFKFGGRFNYLFLKKNFSPFLATGFMYGTGSSITLNSPSGTTNSYTYSIKASPFVQIAGGIEYVSNGGFLIKADVGYAILTIDNNYMILSGSPAKDDLTAMDIAFGSGIVLEFSIGYVWGK